MSSYDFSKTETLADLNKVLAEKSYIQGLKASQADVEVYQSFQKLYPNFSRWFNHIASFQDEFESLPAATGAAAPSAVSPAAKEADAEEDDDDVDLFGDDDEEDDAAAEALKAQRVAEYEKRKAAKPAKPAAKSLVTLDVKPWDDETDLDEMLNYVKSITQDGLIWGSHQFVPVGYGIKKLQINCVVEDEKVSIDELQEKIEEGEDWIQSSDVVAMAKL